MKIGKVDYLVYPEESYVYFFINDVTIHGDEISLEDDMITIYEDGITICYTNFRQVNNMGVVIKNSDDDINIDTELNYFDGYNWFAMIPENDNDVNILKDIVYCGIHRRVEYIDDDFVLV